MNSQLIGNIFVFLAASCLALSAIFTHDILGDVDPIVFAFYCFSATILIVLLLKFMTKHVGNFMQWRTDEPISLCTSIKNNYKHFFYLNFTTAVDWVLYLIALKYIDGAFTNALVFGITPIVALFLSGKQNKTRILYSIFILICLFGIGFNYLSNSPPTNDSNLYTGILLASLAGIAVGGTTVSLKALSSGGMKPLDVILSRYLLTLIVSTIIILAKGLNIQIGFETLEKIVLLGVLFVLLPTYLIQKGVKHISAFNTAVISCSIPALTYFMSLPITTQGINLTQLMLVCLLSTILLILSTRKDVSV